MSGKRQNYQLKLDFGEDARSETPSVASEGTETLAANRGPESPAKTDTLMEEVLERENLKGALQRVNANQVTGLKTRKAVTAPGFLLSRGNAIRIPGTAKTDRHRSERLIATGRKTDREGPEWVIVLRRNPQFN